MRGTVVSAFILLVMSGCGSSLDQPPACNECEEFRKPRAQDTDVKETTQKIGKVDPWTDLSDTADQCISILLSCDDWSEGQSKHTFDTEVSPCERKVGSCVFVLRELAHAHDPRDQPHDTRRLK